MASKFANLALILIIAPWSIASAQTIDGFLGNSAVYITLKEESPLTFDHIPSTFPNLDLPAHFQFETATSLHGTQRVILNTALTRAEVLEQLIAILESAGFVDYHDLAGRDLNNFLVTARTKYSRSYCRDDVGYLTFKMQPLGNQTQITLSNLGEVALGEFISCIHEADKTHDYVPNAHELRQWMQDAPVLIFPDEAIAISPPVIGDTHSSTFSYQSNITVGLDIGIEQLYQLLAAQILQQGWTLDSESIGKFSTSSNWLITPNDKQPLSAALILAQRSNSTFVISLRTTQLDDNSL